MNTKTMKGKTLGIILSLVLVFSLVAVLAPATPVKATVTSVVINTPNAGAPAYAKQSGTITVNYTLNGDGSSESVGIEVYDATHSYSSPYYPVVSDNLAHNSNITLPSVFPAGTYNLKVTVPADIQEDIELGAVIVDNTAPTVTLVSPNGGQYFAGGSSQTISWTATDNNPGDVTITVQETVNAGALWTTIAPASTSYAQGAKSYTGAWVDAVDSTACKVRIKAQDVAGNECSYVLSASYFTIINIAPTVAVTAPNGGETWYGGDSQNITFNMNSPYSSTLSYLIQMSTDGGGTWSDNITASWVTGQTIGDKTYSWTVSHIRDTQCRIQVLARDLAGKIGNDSSNANFTIADDTAPTVTVTAPATGVNWYAGSSQTIAWTASDLVAGNLTYALYYSTDGTSYTQIVGAGGSDTQGNKTYAWTVATPAATSATCKIKVTAVDAATSPNTGTGYSGTFTITPLDGGPTVAVTAPNTAVSWTGGSTQSITWTASHPGDATALLTYTIALSTDSGGTYPTTIATLPNQAQGSHSYSWAVNNIDTALARIRVTATDPASNSASDASDVDFTIEADIVCPPTTQGIALDSGWSLISLPLIPTNTNIESVLGSVLDKVVAVWYYSGGPSGTWSSYAPGGPPGLTTMEAGKAYWINIAAGGPYTLTIQGRKWSCPPAVPPTYSYVAGWNLVGYKSLDTKTVGTYLPQISAQHNTPISGYFSSAAITLTDAQNMVPGPGYWVYFTGAGPWTASTADD